MSCAIAWSAELPPVHRVALRGHVAQHPSGALNAGAAAGQPTELPQLTSGALVLMQDLVDDEGVVVAGAETIDGPGHVLDQVTEARLVVRRDQRPIRLALTLRAHLAIVP